jgi:flagellin-like hook-associated protein FlgL
MIPNTNIAIDEHRLEKEIFGVDSITDTPGNGSHPEARTAGDLSQEMVLAPLVDKVAYGLARVLVVAMRDLENHIARETQQVGTTVGRQLDTLQASVQGLTEALSEQRSLGLSVDRKCEQLAVVATSLEERATRQEAELAALRTETRELSTSSSERIDTLCKELEIQQEDIAAVKGTLGSISSRVDSLVERLDRQADALRSVYSAYAQRETVLEQLTDGLAKLRAYPAPVPAARL